MKQIKSRFLALFSNAGALFGSCGGACGVACAASGGCGSYALFGLIGISSSSMQFLEKLTPFFLVLTIFSLAPRWCAIVPKIRMSCLKTAANTQIKEITRIIRFTHLGEEEFAQIRVISGKTKRHADFRLYRVPLCYKLKTTRCNRAGAKENRIPMKNREAVNLSIHTALIMQSNFISTLFLTFVFFCQKYTILNIQHSTLNAQHLNIAFALKYYMWRCVTSVLYLRIDY